jgi:hypothetical protein
MARNERQMLPAPCGMLSNYDYTLIPEHQSVLLDNFLPARNGRLYSFPQLTNVCSPAYFNDRKLPFNITQVALWRSTSSPTNDCLVLFDDSAGVWQGAIVYNYGLNAQYESPTYQISNVRYLGQLPTPVDYYSRIRTTQFQQDLIITRAEGMTPYRVSTDDTTGNMANMWLFQCGLPSGSLSSTVSQVNVGTGGIVATGTYGYQIVFTDEKGRQSSPSAYQTAQVTVANSNLKVFLNVPLQITGADNGIRGYILYRSLVNQPAGPYYYASAGTVASNYTGAYQLGIVDSVPETSLNQAQIAPQPGQNDAPQQSTMVTVWKSRVVMDVYRSRNSIQISNQNTGVQWASTGSPTDPADITFGTSIILGGDGGDAVAGLCALGDILGIWRRFTFWQVGGEDITSFISRPVHQIGCTSADSVVRCDNVIVWMSESGVYELSFQDGFSLHKLSKGIDDQFLGMTHMNSQINGPTGYDSFLDTEAVKSICSAVYWQNRYILNFGPYQYIYDFLGEQETGQIGQSWSRSLHMTQATCVVKQNGRPETLFIAPFLSYAWGTYPLRPNCLGHIAIITPIWQDIVANQMPTYVKQSQVRCSLLSRPFDGQGAVVIRERLKEALKFSVFGTTGWVGAVNTVPMCSATVQSESGASETMSNYIRPNNLYSDNALLFEYMPSTGSVIGRVIQLKVNFNALNLIITNILGQYAPKDGG